MKRFFITTIMLLWVAITYGQLSGTKQIPIDYPTLAAAITDLNTQGVGAGGVTIDLTAGTPETAPVGGYVITATGTLANPILIKGNGNIITSNGTLASGTINDAFFKIIGGDYITIDGFVMQENAANTTTTASSNNMTEFGVALFYSSTTDGPQNCTIQNNTITLGVAYQNAFGVYATSRTSATSMTTTADITSPTGAFSNLKVLNNTISSVNLGVVLVGSTSSANMTTNIEVGNNAITFGRTGTISSYSSVSGSVNGIYINNSLNVNVHNNTLTCNGTNTGGVLRGIYHNASGTIPTTGTYTNSYNFNTITISNGAATATYGIHIDNLNNTFTTNINGNTINNLSATVASTASVYGIYQQGTALHQNINSNLFYLTPTTVPGSSAGVYVINGNNTVPPNGNQTVQNNYIQLSKSTAGGPVYGYYGNASSTNSVTKNILNNTFENITLTGSTVLYGIYDTDGSSSTDAPVKTISNNIIHNITGGTGAITVIQINYGTHEVFGNNINNITNGAGITGISAGGTSSTLANVYNNVIKTLSTTSGSINGIVAAANASGAISNVYSNNVYDLEATSSTSSVVGISVTGGNTATVYNNFIKELYTPTASSSTQPMIAGIALLNGTNSNVYYNTVYMDATSTGADFSTCALYASTTPSVKLINNILVNNSTPNGTGMTVSIRRAESSLSKYDNSSNNNCLFAGTPSANNVIYYDGTNSYEIINDLVAAVSPRETFSIRDLPPFVNIATAPYDLHIQTTIATGTESGGIAITGFDNDIDNDIRYGSTGYTGGGIAPDMGADEFNGSPNFTCGVPAPGNTLATSSSICLGENIILSLQNVVSGTGISYQWQSSTDGVSFSNISGATLSTCSVIPANEVYYQCVVNCLNGPSTATSTPIHITFSNSVTSTTPGSRCGAGVVTLQATGSAGTTINWYDAQMGGNLVGIGSPYTPTISSTTDFYAAAVGSTVGTVLFGNGANSGSSAPYCPFNGTYGGIKSQYLFKASELAAAGLTSGNITSFTFYVTSIGQAYNGFYVDLGNTSLTDFTSTANIQGGLTNVYSTASITPTLGANTITFSTPFVWDGTSNIILSLSWSNENTSNTPCSISYDATINYSSQSYRKDSETAANLYAFTGSTAASGTFSSSQNRPKISFAGYVSCSSPRVAVTATIGASPALTLTADQTVCNNGIATISVTSTLSDYDSYVWTPESDLYTDAACTVPYVSGASATTVYAKTATAGSYTYTCTSNNSSTLCSNIATSTVDVLPAAPSIAASPNTLCISGTSLLTATPATGFGAATFQWQNSTDNVTFNDIASATNATYTTPNLTVTTYYKLNLMLGATVCSESNVETVTVNNPQVTSTTPATRCGAGTVDLTATVSAGSTLNWYDAATNGNLVGTGSPFTTPIITATTDYYATSEVISPMSATFGSGVSSGSSVPYNPFNGGYGGMKSQYLFKASELIASGLTPGKIESFTFYITSTGTTYNGFYVDLGSTLLNDFTSTANIQGGLTNVYYNASVTPIVGANTITFTTPYYWDGTSNIILSLSWSNGNTSNTSSNVSYDATTNYSSQSYRKDSETAANLYAFTGSTAASGVFASSQNRPKISFDGNSYCSGLRVAVTATVTTADPLTISADQTVCNNGIATINVTSTLADYDSYTWDPVTDLYTDAACTTPYVAGNSATTVYVKLATPASATYTCTANNSSSLCSNIATTTVSTLPSSITVSATPEIICQSGTATFTANPSTGFGVATFQWQSSTDGTNYSDLSGATNLNLTTSTLTQTTWFKLLVFSGATNCLESNAVMITVNNPSITSNTDGTRCGTGTVNLEATVSTGSTLNWYDAATNGNLVGTGSPFTTPVITATTNYYAEAEVPGTSGVITIGNGTTANTESTYPTAFGNYWYQDWTQFVFTAAELQAAGLQAGNITSLAFNVTAVPDPNTPPTDYQVRLGATSNSTLSTWQTTGLILCFGPATPPAIVVGWNTISFTTPYYWDGVSNILVDIRGTELYGSGNAVTLNTTTGGNTLIHAHATSSNSSYWTSNPTPTATTARLNTRFNGMINAACLSPRVAITATVTPAPAVSINSSTNTACSGSSVILTAQSTNNDYTYAWSTSDNGEIITVNPTSFATFVVTATDANTGCVTTAETDINVYPLPVATATVDNASITCGQSVQLTAGDLYSPDQMVEDFNNASMVFTTVNTSTGGTPTTAAWTVHPDGYSYGTSTPEIFHSNDNSQFIMSNSDAQGMSSTTHTELISPVFSSVGADSITIEMYHYFHALSSDEAKVEIYDGSQWITIQSWTTTQGSSSNFVHVVLPLTNTYLNNSNLQIRFVYDATWDYFWAIDNVGVNLYHANTLSWTSTPLGFTSGIYNPTDAPATSTQYNVVVTSSHGCTNTANVTVTVNNLAAPTVSVNNLCGESELTASNYTGTLAWSTTETTPTITVNNSNAVSVTYTDGVCTSDAASATPAPVEIPSTPTVDPINSCFAETVSAFTATSNYSDFVWYADAALTTPIGNGSSYQSPEVNVGTYTYYVVALNSICASDAATAVLNINALPTVTISQNVDTLYSTANTGNQWYNSQGAITGATDSTYTVIAEEDYFVVVTDANGCSAMSNTIHVIPTAISNNLIESMISVRPNPAHEYVVVNIGRIDNAQVQIIAADGKVVYNTNVNQNQQTISLNGFVTGLYTIKVTTNSKTIQKKLVIE